MSENTTKTPRITKAMKFEAVKALLNGETPTINFSTEDAVAFVDHELALLEKKNANTGEKKPTAVQIANEGYKERIVDFLGEKSEDKDGYTVTELKKLVPGFAEDDNISNNRITALLMQLGEGTENRPGEGKVARVEVKGKALYRLA